MAKKYLVLGGLAILLFFLSPLGGSALDLKRIITPTPTLVSLCPEGYECLTESEASVQFDGNFEQYPDKTCGEAWEKEFKVSKYCFKAGTRIDELKEIIEPEKIIEPEPAGEEDPEPAPIPAEETSIPQEPASLCPSGCQCLTGAEAEQAFGSRSFKACEDDPCGSKWEGDLKVNRYCYSEIPLNECTDSDGGKNYEVKGSIAGYSDTCSPFDDEILEEYYPDTSSGKCVAQSENYDCNSICEDGACLPPTCEDLIENQGEQGMDCGGPCPDTCACPSGCACLTGPEAEKSFGAGAFESCQDDPCGSAWQGDLNISKYCYKKIESSNCVDTDGGANINVKGSAPGCEDRCSPLAENILIECLATEEINGCKVTESNVECDGLCSDGACLPPTCEDLLENQGETGIDCGGPCPACVECSWCGDYIEPIRVRGAYNSGMIDIVFVPDKTYKPGGDLNYEKFKRDAKAHIRNGYFMMDTWAAEADHSKSVSLVEMNASGDVKVQAIELTPRHELRVITGELDQILIDAANDSSREDYITVRLLDRVPLLNPMAKLRQHYPNALHIDRPMFGPNAEIEERIDHRKVTTFELFESFYRQTTGEKLSNAQEATLSEVVEELQGRSGGEAA